MKTISCLIFALAGIACADAQIRTLPHQWHATIKVLDENERPVPYAEVRIGFSAASLQGDPIPDKIAGHTDTNGVFVAGHVDRSVKLDFMAQKTGYYPFTSQHFLGFSEKDNPDWNPSATLLLKKIRNPIPMHVKTVSYFVPTNSQPVGFDLMSGDWVTPYGHGKTKDIIFTTHFDKRSDHSK